MGEYDICPQCGEKITEEDRKKGNVEMTPVIEEKDNGVHTVQKPAHKKCRKITK